MLFFCHYVWNYEPPQTLAKPLFLYSQCNRVQQLKIFVVLLIYIIKFYINEKKRTQRKNDARSINGC